MFGVFAADTVLFLMGFDTDWRAKAFFCDRIKDELRSFENFVALPAGFREIVVLGKRKYGFALGVFVGRKARFLFFFLCVC